MDCSEVYVGWSSNEYRERPISLVLDCTRGTIRHQTHENLTTDYANAWPFSWRAIKPRPKVCLQLQSKVMVSVAASSVCG